MVIIKIKNHFKYRLDGGLKLNQIVDLKSVGKGHCLEGLGTSFGVLIGSCVPKLFVTFLKCWEDILQAFCPIFEHCRCL